MQFYAFDEKKNLIHAVQAKKNLNYQCIECQTRVRLRGGIHRQLHFYHLDRKRTCGLNQKGMVHLQLQNFLAKNLLKDDVQLECRFPTINRIADVAWFSEKIVFEIQCSPISAIEVQQRNQDYQSQGWSVVWILHDQRYNQKYLSPAEKALREHPHYFSNMNADGKGLIYDQFEIVEKSLRKIKMDKLVVDLKHLFVMSENRLKKHSLSMCQNRVKQWPFYFKGDLLEVQNLPYYQAALDFEKKQRHEKFNQTISQLGLHFIHHLFIHPYRVFFRYLLEKACR